MFGAKVMGDWYEPVSIFVLAPGAFFVLAMLTAAQNKLKAPSATNVKNDSKLACGGRCQSCDRIGCGEKVKEGEAE